MLLHIPHSSLNLNGVEDKNNEAQMVADLYTEELFYHPYSDIITFKYNRLFCDVERFEDDSMNHFKRGICYEKYLDGSDINKSDSQRTEALRAYRQHHDNLYYAVNAQLSFEDTVTIVDCHAYSSIPLPFEDAIKERPQVCIGYDDFHKIDNLEEIIAIISDYGYSCGINTPYEGSLVPIEYYNVDSNVKSIMIELRKDIYMNEETFEKTKDFTKVKTMVSDILTIISYR